MPREDCAFDRAPRSCGDYVPRVTLPPRALLREALGALGIRRFLLGVHDAAFPMGPEEDAGIGTPHSDAGGELLALAADLGLDGLQLGPQGATSDVNPSPYDGTLFSRSPLQVALAPLVREGLLDGDELARARAPASDRVAYAHAFRAIPRALACAWARFRSRPEAGLAARLEAFRAREAGWLERDAAWEGADPAAYAFVQLLAREQHERFRARARAEGLVLFGDLQVGMSARDAAAVESIVLRDWRLGAPPSRTNPAGQAWNFPVLDPRAYRAADGSDGPALAFVRARARKAFEEYDGLRVDHPHGLVCPWVYRVGDDPGRAVRAGARLFDSPDRAELAGFAIARVEQLDRAAPRHADGRVTALDDEQVARYAVLLDAVLAAAPRPEDVACEVLSTQPYPLARVIARHRLGRFRVTQKADLAAPGDVYRSDQARPEDWILLGNHDNRPILAVADHWIASGEARRSAGYLAGRLLPPDPEAWLAATAADPRRLAQAAFADLFVGPASHVYLHFTDLLGFRDRYNAPGVVAGANWSLRIPADVRGAYARARAAGDALDVPAALATALRARGTPAAARLARALELASR